MPPRELRVCIVGAGAAGLRIAMFLDYLGVNYDILEASERHGGRVLTHHFSTLEHDYYDVGAMRFPETQALGQTFKLFKELELHPDGKVINYVMSIPANIQLFNNVLTTNELAAAENDPHDDHPPIPPSCLEYIFTKDDRHFKGAAAISAAAMEPLKKALAHDFHLGWQLLMTQDHLTTREFMRNFLARKGLVPKVQSDVQFVVLQWMERMNSSTGSYDFAITQEVLESMEFDYPSGYGRLGAVGTAAQKWVCIDGGTELITDRMHKKLKKKLDYLHRVVAVRADQPIGGRPEVFVKVHDHPEFDDKSYAHTVLTTTLACASQMDLTRAGLTYGQREGVRSLRYGAAVKIGIKFETRWWQDLAQIGGVSYTDRPIRVVVYPSYGDLGPSDKPGVLIASYAWTQDAVRLGANIQGNAIKASATPSGRI